MHVDVDRAVRHVDEHDRDRIAPARHELAVAHRERVQHAAIAHRPPADEQLHAARGGLRELGRAEEALHANAALFARSRDHARRDPRAEQRLRAREAIAIRRRLERGAAVVAQPQMQLRVRHRDPRDELGDVRRLGRLALQELQPRGHVPQEVRDLDARADRRADLGRPPTSRPPSITTRVAARSPSRRVVSVNRDDARDRRQRLAAKPHRGEPPQIVERAQLRRGVALERLDRIGRRHAAAVVDHADQVTPAAGGLDRDHRRAGVDRVVDQLLDDRGRSLDDLAGGDLIDDGCGQERGSRP